MPPVSMQYACTAMSGSSARAAMECEGQLRQWVQQQMVQTRHVWVAGLEKDKMHIQQHGVIQLIARDMRLPGSMPSESRRLACASAASPQQPPPFCAQGYTLSCVTSSRERVERGALGGAAVRDCAPGRRVAARSSSWRVTALSSVAVAAAFACTSAVGAAAAALPHDAPPSARGDWLAHTLILSTLSSGEHSSDAAGMHALSRPASTRVVALHSLAPLLPLVLRPLPGRAQAPASVSMQRAS